ncbi:MAG: AI-2E family transporter, partial [Ruthenibacterium sp.]
KEKLKAQMQMLLRAILPRTALEKVCYVAKLTGRTFSNFIAGQCMEACILGTLCWLGMLLFRFPYAPMIGALVGLTALIPIVGGFVGTVVGAFMIMMINPMQAIWFIIFLQCLQQIEGNLIYPRVVGSSVGLPPIWVLAAVTLGGSLGGILGMLFAVPVASVLFALTKAGVHEKLKREDA